jgi:IS30 family transposase
MKNATTLRNGTKKVARRVQTALRNAKTSKAAMIRQFIGKNLSASEIAQRLEKKGITVYASEIYRLMPQS